MLLKGCLTLLRAARAVFAAALAAHIAFAASLAAQQPTPDVVTTSQYVRTRDGTRLAVDVHLPRTYDGRMIFLEPMISHAYLTSLPDACTAIKAPRAWPTSGYYPTSYCVRYDAATATYRITLEGLVQREADASQQ